MQRSYHELHPTEVKKAYFNSILQYKIILSEVTTNFCWAGMFIINWGLPISNFKEMQLYSHEIHQKHFFFSILLYKIVLSGVTKNFLLGWVCIITRGMSI